MQVKAEDEIRWRNLLSCLPWLETILAPEIIARRAEEKLGPCPSPPEKAESERKYADDIAEQEKLFLNMCLKLRKKKIIDLTTEDAEMLKTCKSRAVP